MKLHAGNLAALNDRCKGLAVIGRGDGVAGDGRHVTMREVRLCAALDAFHDRCVAGFVDRVPSDVWNLERRAGRRSQSPAFSGQNAESANIRRFFAA